jgi:diacylglycerol kinase
MYGVIVIFIVVLAGKHQIPISASCWVSIWLERCGVMAVELMEAAFENGMEASVLWSLST